MAVFVASIIVVALITIEVIIKASLRVILEVMFVVKSKIELNEAIARSGQRSDRPSFGAAVIARCCRGAVIDEIGHRSERSSIR